MGLRLLDFDYISSLGIGAWWTVFVLSIHTIWSTAVPIALVEGLTPTARRTPWLGPVGLAIIALVLAFGCAVTLPCCWAVCELMPLPNCRRRQARALSTGPPFC